MHTCIEKPSVVGLRLAFVAGGLVRRWKIHEVIRFLVPCLMSSKEKTGERRKIGEGGGGG